MAVAEYSVIPSKMRKIDPQIDLCEDLIKLEQELCSSLSLLSFSSPVTHVYNPLIYAKETHQNFVRKYCKVGHKVLFLGMNPGPFGMAQNGVSFQSQTWIDNSSPGVTAEELTINLAVLS